MIIRLLFAFLTFMLPFIIYASYCKIKDKQYNPLPKDVFLTLCAMGIGLVMTSIIIFYIFFEDKGTKQGEFVPAYVAEDGRLIPSHFK